MKKCMNQQNVQKKRKRKNKNVNMHFIYYFILYYACNVNYNRARNTFDVIKD